MTSVAENACEDGGGGGGGEGDGRWTKMTTKARLRVVNGHYQLWCNETIDLRQLKTVIPNGALHLGRPTMLSCLIEGKRVQFFPNGTIQILAGGMTRHLFVQIFHVIYHRLKLCNASRTIHLSKWTVNNLVVHFNLYETFSFDNFVCNGQLSYEPELFPAVLISKWKSSAHVTLFPNGKGVITGIRRRSEAVTILNDILHFLHHRVRRRRRQLCQNADYHLCGQ